MSETPRAEIGAIGWTDLTVENAEQIRDFYAAVTGWRPCPVNMGSYSDFSMTTPGSGKAVAGICHARGVNATLPPQWPVYITVADADQAAASCRELGGEMVVGSRDMGDWGGYCVIRDPAGAVAALFAFRSPEDAP